MLRGGPLRGGGREAVATPAVAPAVPRGLGRRAFLTAAAVGAGPLLAACAAAGAGGQSAEGGGGTAQAVLATLEIWSPAMGPEQTNAQEEVHREFEAKYPHLTLKLTQIPGGWDPVVEKVQLSVSSGVPPSASRLPDNVLRLLIFQSQLTSLGPLIKRDRFETGVLDKGMIQRGTVDGKLYTLPWSGGMLALAYSVDLFEKAGLPLPETTKPMTWHRIVDAAGKIRRLGDDVWGFRVGGNLETPNWDAVKEWLPWLWSNGNDYFDNTETKPLFGDQKGIASVQLLTDLMRKHRVAPAPGEDRPNSTTGKFGMWVQQSDVIVNIKRDAPGVRLGCSLIPVGPDGKTSYGVQGGSFIAIPQGAKSTDESWRYLRWVTDVAINLRLVAPAFQDPVHASNRVKAPFSEYPQYAAFVEQYKTARARPGNPAYRLTEESTAEQLQAAYKGEKGPAEAVKAAVEKAIAIIQQNTRE